MRKPAAIIIFFAVLVSILFFFSAQKIEAQITEAVEYVEQGKQLMGTNQYEEALNMFNRAAALEPDSPVPHFYRGAALYWLERYNESASALDQALKLDANNYLIWYYRGKTANAQKDYKTALGCFEKSIENNYQFKEAWFDKGLILYAMEQYRSCISSMGRVVSLDSSDGRAYCVIGMSYFWLGDMAMARQYIDKGLSLNPSYREKIPERIRKGVDL